MGLQTKVNTSNSRLNMKLNKSTRKAHLKKSGYSPQYDHYLIYAIRKIGIPRGQPRFVEGRNFKHFHESKFKMDLINAPWPRIDYFQDANGAIAA